MSHPDSWFVALDSEGIAAGRIDLRPVQVDGSWITAIARAVSIEPHRQVWEIDLKRDNGRRFCVSTLTVAVVPQARAPN